MSDTTDNVTPLYQEQERKMREFSEKNVLLSQFDNNRRGLDWAKDRVFYDLPTYSNSWDWLIPCYVKILNLVSKTALEAQEKQYTPEGYPFEYNIVVCDYNNLKGAIASGKIDEAFNSVYWTVNKYWKR